MRKLPLSLKDKKYRVFIKLSHINTLYVHSVKKKLCATAPLRAILFLAKAQRREEKTTSNFVYSWFHKKTTLSIASPIPCAELHLCLRRFPAVWHRGGSAQRGILWCSRTRHGFEWHPSTLGYTFRMQTTSP